MAWSAADRTAVAQSILSCFGEDPYMTGRFLKFLQSVTGQNLVSIVQTAALTWSPFLTSGLSVGWFNTEIQRYFDGTTL